MNYDFNNLMNKFCYDKRLNEAVEAAKERFGDAVSSLDSEGYVSTLAYEDNAQELIDKARHDEETEVCAAFETELRGRDDWAEHKKEFLVALEKVETAVNNQLCDLCDRIVAGENVPA